MPRKKLIDGAYYWVKRKPSTNPDNGTSTYPHWEPMLWDEKDDRFHTRSGWTRLDGIVKIGDRIAPQGEKRTTVTAWMPLDYGEHAGKLMPDIANLSTAKLVARHRSLSKRKIPIKVEVSWSAEEFALIEKLEKKVTP